MRRLFALLVGFLALHPAGALAKMQAPGFKPLFMSGKQLRWRFVPGQPLVLRYGFVTGPLNTPAARNCGAMDGLSRLSEMSALSLRRMKAEIARGMRTWSTVAPIRFLEAADWRTADILIGAGGDPRGSAYADVLPEAARPATIDSKARYIERALICFSPEHTWKSGFGGNARAYALHYVAAHETGHALGLDHPSPSGQLMSFRYGERFDTLQPGDRRGILTLYGGLHPAEQWAGLERLPRLQAPRETFVQN